MENKIILDSNYKVEVSEIQDDPTYMEVKFIICDFSTNRNGVRLNREKIEEWKDTLITKPLVGKIQFNNRNNEEDFTTHQAKKIYKRDENGKIIQTYKFGTEAFGVFTEVNIETIDEVEYITATARIWRRFEQACEIIQNRFDNNIPLGTSWEINILDESKDSEGRIINEGVFFGLAVLGKNVTPAYQSNDSSMLELVAEQEENELAEAILEDIKSINQEELISIDTDNNSVENNLKDELKGGNIDMAEENKTEISALTMDDLYTKVRKAIRKATGEEDKWYYISFLYPLDFKAIAHSYDDEETIYSEFTYAVSENGDVSITGQKEVEMVFIPKSDNDTSISELQTKLSEKETELSTKLDEIVKLGETIQSLNTTISEKDKEIAELEPMKQQIAEVEAKKKEEEETAKKKCLSEMLVSSKYFSAEEVEASEELQTMISELNETGIKTKIAERVIEQASKVVTEPKVETSEENVEISTDLNAESKYDYDNPSSYLLKRARRNIK